ncbi:DUF2510 domain-containing protein [Propionibacteriaceae bacterium Y1923]
MAKAGWYPDPSGRDGQVRYFDGAAWTSDVRPAPTGAGPAGGGDEGGDESGGGGGRAGLLVAIAAVLAISLVVWLWLRPGGGDTFPEDTNSAEPTISAWDETSTPSSNPPTPSDDPTNTGGAPAACPEDTFDRAPGQPSGGYYTGGGLAYPEIPGWENSRGWGLDWATDRAGQRNTVTPGWVAIAVVGEIDREVFPSPQVATNQLMQCMASSYYYRSFVNRTDLLSEAITIDGKDGWKLVSEVHVNGEPVPGDVVTIIVLDVGREGRFAVFCGEAPIGDAERNQLVNTAVEGLQVRA